MSKLPQVTSDFLDENEKLSQTVPNLKKGGPYSKNERDSRRKEVYRLHFDYGYSARKIAELMKINRNTVNGDIDYWYSKIIVNGNTLDSTTEVLIHLQRLDIQRSRLREQLDKVEAFQEKLALERLILEIDSKILHTHNKLITSTRSLATHSTERLNEWMKDHKRDERYLTQLDMYSFSTKAYEKILKIMEQDRLDRRTIY